MALPVWAGSKVWTLGITSSQTIQGHNNTFIFGFTILLPSVIILKKKLKPIKILQVNKMFPSSVLSYFILYVFQNVLIIISLV